MVLGLGNWFKNFAQVDWKNLTPENLADIENPWTEYMLYCTFKTIQIGSFIGGVIVHPAYRYYLLKQLKPETTTTNSTKIIRNACRRAQGRFLLASLALGPVLAMLNIQYKGWTRGQLADRCYEIRCDSDMLVWDRSTVVFGFIGWYWKRFQGAVDGINLSMAYTIAYILVLRDHTYPFLVDKLNPEEKFKSVSEGFQNRTTLSKFLSSKEEEKK